MFQAMVITALLVSGLTWLARILLSLKAPKAPNISLRDFYRRAWGKPWPHPTIETVTYEELLNATAISTLRDDSATLHPDFNRMDYVEGSWIEKEQVIPLRMEYLCYNGIRAVKEALYSRSDSGDWDTFIVRSEYTELEREFELYYSIGGRGMVITGQPGTGKAYFLIYILLRRLERKQPTAFQIYADRYLIFDAQGVSAFRDEDIPPDRLGACVALVDSCSDHITPCDALLRTAAFTLQVAAPELHRWEAWSSRACAGLLLIEPPSVLEVVATIKALGMSTKLAISLTRKWGPCIRTIAHLSSIMDEADRCLAEAQMLKSAQAAAIMLSADHRTLSQVPHVLVDAVRNDTFALLFIRLASEPATDGVEFRNRVRGLASIPTRYLKDVHDAACGI